MENQIDQHSKVVLSPLYTLPESEEVIDFTAHAVEEIEEIRKVKNGELYFLSDKGGNYFLINPTIRIFLQSFSKPRTLQEVTEEFAKISNCDPSRIEGVMLQFFKKMQEQGIIINPETAQTLQDILTHEPIEIPKYNIGDRIGDYVVADIVLVKNASQLYLARHPAQEQEVVIKTIIFPTQLPEKIKNRAIRKFRQEFSFMQELSWHPNVCQLVEYHEEGDFIFAAVDYIKGISLRNFAAKVNTTITHKISVIRQLLAAIAHVQTFGIVHGDIHLSNFIVQNDGQVKLIDFGLSNHALPKENEILRNGAVHGCVPPERVKISAFGFLGKRADYRSEVFQLGVIIFYILYGEYPFAGFTWQKMAQEITEKILSYPDKTPAGEHIPESLLTLLEKALHKDPKDRFAHATEMSAFLTANIEQQKLAQ